MALEDRVEIMSVVEEAYGLVGRVLSTDSTRCSFPGMRPDIMGRIGSAEIDPLVTDSEMLSLLRVAYSELVRLCSSFATSSLERLARTTTPRSSRFG